MLRIGVQSNAALSVSILDAANNASSLHPFDPTKQCAITLYPSHHSFI